LTLKKALITTITAIPLSEANEIESVLSIRLVVDGRTSGFDVSGLKFTPKIAVEIVTSTVPSITKSVDNVSIDVQSDPSSRPSIVADIPFAVALTSTFSDIIGFKDNSTSELRFDRLFRVNDIPVRVKQYAVPIGSPT
jgi:hypothetical protein